MAHETPAHLRQGIEAEQHARAHLEQHGLRLLEGNYRSPYGEIDLVMEEGKTLVFVEVRFRRSEDFGAPAETIDARKQARLRATAEHYLQRHRGDSKRPCRFDIVAISGREGLRWLQNAF